MSRHGFVRVAAAVPRLQLANPRANVRCHLDLMRQAADLDVDVLVFPELGLTGYTCGDLFHQGPLLEGAKEALGELLIEGAGCFPGVSLVGLPLAVEDRLYNVAAVFQKGLLLGIVPKSYLPTYKEFYEARWFAPGDEAGNRTLALLGQRVPFGTDLLFEAGPAFPDLTLGVEICEDLWVPIPPSSRQALAGATLLCNLSASNETIGKGDYRRGLVAHQSAACLAGYVYAAAGVHESSTDLVFGGHALIAENGVLLAETAGFHRDGSLLLGDLDLERLANDRLKQGSFGAGQPEVLSRSWRRVPVEMEEPRAPRRLQRRIEAQPFVPAGQELARRCRDIFHIQVAGLARRLEHLGEIPLSLGISGGLDSTLALLVCCKTLDLLGAKRTRLAGFTLPGFGTTSRTRDNARRLQKLLGITAREIDIRSLCLEEMRALGHRPFGIDLAGLDVAALEARLQEVPEERRQDLVFENVQARMRTSLLMNHGFTIGTGDLSELALGWCTYNADHMSMYNPNVSIPKTLVRFLVSWAAENEFAGETRSTLLDVAATEISPELLPAGKDGTAPQRTEAAIGPYELHDFFLFHFLRYGAGPEKILYLAEHAEFDGTYAAAERRRWLQVFLRRFFANQFKRSCLPDGPKVGSISLSPRGDWRMPSDAAAALWLNEVEKR